MRTTDRHRAEELGRERLAELIRGAPLVDDATVTLGKLWERYRREAQSFLDSAETTQRDAAARAAVLIGYFGDGFDVNTLTEDRVRAYAAQRLRGGIRQSGRDTRPVRARSLQADLVLLNMMLRWATTVRTTHGRRWLEDNPLRGIRRVREQNPRRPVATWERFVKTRGAMQDLAEHAKRPDERDRWVKVELALVLAEATGRRLNAIRQLRWEDIDLERRTIRWRAESDKKRREAIIPLPDVLVEELRGFRNQLGALGGWVFARESDGQQPMDRHLFDKWLAAAERRAGLPKLPGGLWHPYRRKWATERKDLSLKDVAAAGGWKDVETLLQSLPAPRRGHPPRGDEHAQEGPRAGHKRVETATQTATRSEKQNEPLG